MAQVVMTAGLSGMCQGSGLQHLQFWGIFGSLSFLCQRQWSGSVLSTGASALCTY